MAIRWTLSLPLLQAGRALAGCFLHTAARAPYLCDTTPLTVPAEAVSRRQRLFLLMGGAAHHTKTADNILHNAAFEQHIRLDTLDPSGGPSQLALPPSLLASHGPGSWARNWVACHATAFLQCQDCAILEDARCRLRLCVHQHEGNAHSTQGERLWCSSGYQRLSSGLPWHD